MIVPKHYENLNMLHENTMPYRSYYVPASACMGALVHDREKSDRIEFLNVVNGLALGCDTEALKGTIAGGGRCIGILPAGLDDILPKSNQKLADEIVMKDGCLISEYPVGTPVKKYQYVRRDRLQSGLSDGVLIVEAEEQSGTMHTVEFAQNQYKRLACYYHKLVELSSGNRKLEEAGQISVIEDKKRLEEFVETVMKEQTYEQLTLF